MKDEEATSTSSCRLHPSSFDVKHRQTAVARLCLAGDGVLMRTIAHISDIHFGRIDQEVVEGLVADLSARDPSLLVVSGDLTQRARRWQYRAAADFLARLPKPQLIVPGNHDVPLYDVIRRFFAPLQFYTRYITTDLRPIFRDDQMLVIGLNTTRAVTPRLHGFWKDGAVSPAQLDELCRVMLQAPPQLFKVVVTHHPFIPAPDEDPNDIVHGALPALGMLQKCRVDLLLAGHLHVGYCGDVGTHHTSVACSIVSAQAGSATSTRRRGQPNSYNWIILRPDELTIEVRSWDGRSFAPTATTHFVRRDRRWRRSE
jgi:3',5'-cyclic AMP phosphodiesterase CpdA